MRLDQKKKTRHRIRRIQVYKNYDIEIPPRYLYIFYYSKEKSMVNNFDTLRKIWNESDSEDKGLTFSVDIENSNGINQVITFYAGFDASNLSEEDLDEGYTDGIYVDVKSVEPNDPNEKFHMEDGGYITFNQKEDDYYHDLDSFIIDSMGICGILFHEDVNLDQMFESGNLKIIKFEDCVWENHEI